MKSTHQAKTTLSSAPIQTGILQRKCTSCGQHTIAGGECTDCGKKKIGLQRKLTIGASNDPLELEADQIADRVMAASPNSVVSSAPLSIQRFTGQTVGQAEMVAPASVESVLSSPGSPLEPGLQEDMSQRFGHDFSRVRVHTGDDAARSARDVNAKAYTLGQNIVFGAGQFSPKTQIGQRLIAHELSHVLQQSSSLIPRQIQAMPDDKKNTEKSKTFPFKIFIDHDMDADELTHEFVKQYYNYDSEAQIQTKLSLWKNTSNLGAKPDDVKRGFIIASITQMYQMDFDSLTSDEKKAVNTETDRRFWESTGYKPGKKLGKSPEDRKMARAWLGTRNAVLTEDKQQKEIDTLPDDIKKILFAGDVNAPTVSPDDYTQVLRIANKLGSLSLEAQKGYLSRINASTTSLDTLESSINSYIQFQVEREQESKENETAAKPLFGSEQLYILYQNYKSSEQNAKLAHNLGSSAKNKDEDSTSYLDDRRDELLTKLMVELKKKDFSSITSFEAAIEAYRITFRTQAVNLALDVLARYDHMLFEEKNKLQQPFPGGAASIAQGIAGTSASAKYKEADEQISLARNLQMGRDPKETWMNKQIMQAKNAAASARAEAEAEVIRGSGHDPLVAERGTDRENLAGLDAAGTQSYLLKTIREREVDVLLTRKEFREDPDRVFKLPELITASQQIQGINGDTTYGMIVSDYIKSAGIKHLLSQIAIGALAIALTFLVPGGGWLAAAALVANASISTYQAYSAYKEYEEQERDYKLHFLSEEPSLFWVGVAIAAAALDLGMAASAVWKESAIAIKALEGPLRDFSKGSSNLAELILKIEAAEGLNATVKVALERELKAAASAKEAWKEALGKTYTVLPGMVDPIATTQTFRALYYSVKRGANTVAKLSADAKYLDILSDITRMSGAERAELELAFEEVKTLVKAGQAKSIDDISLLGYVDRWAINRGKPGFQAKLLDEMKAWRPLTVEQQKTINTLNLQKRAVTALYEQKTAAQEELAALRVKPEKSAEDIVEIRKLEDELTQLDPVSYPPKKKEFTGRGKIVEAEATLTSREIDAAKAELTLYDRLRAVAPSNTAKERALKGAMVDQVGSLKTKPGKLQADHIVSVREVSDMDGFNNLLWNDQKVIVDMKENLIAMDASANASKGDRTWLSWSQSSTFYNSETITKMVKREIDVRAAIQAAIKDRLSKLPARKL